jgi:hypothetical protein
MRINRKFAIPLITAAALMGTGGIAYASVTPNPTYTPPTIIPTVTPTPPIITPTPTPRPRRYCTVQFDRLQINPTFNPFTGQRIRVGQWDRVCFSRFGGVTVTPLSSPISF